MVQHYSEMVQKCPKWLKLSKVVQMVCYGTKMIRNGPILKEIRKWSKVAQIGPRLFKIAT